MIVAYKATIKDSNADGHTFSIAGGRIICLQCRAQSKRTGQQCRAPAMTGKEVCRFHGGRSTGPKTNQGRARCAEVKTIHGRETRSIRTERSEALARLGVLEMLGHSIGLKTGNNFRNQRYKTISEENPKLNSLLKSNEAKEESRNQSQNTIPEPRPHSST